MRMFFVSGVLVLAAGCGSATETDLFSTEGSTPSPDSGIKDSGPFGHPDTGLDAGKPEDSGKPVIDVSQPDVFDANVIDTGPPDPGISCNAGMTFCTPKSEVCCVQGFDTTQSQCTASATDCMNSGNIPVACQNHAECAANQICCGIKNGQTQYSEVRCQSTCSGGDVRFCNPNISPDECTSIGKACMPSGLLPGYNVCN